MLQESSFSKCGLYELHAVLYFDTGMTPSSPASGSSAFPPTTMSSSTVRTVTVSPGAATTRVNGSSPTQATNPTSQSSTGTISGTSRPSTTSPARATMSSSSPPTISRYSITLTDPAYYPHCIPRVCFARPKKDRAICTYIPRNVPRNLPLDRSKKLLCWDVEKYFPHN